MTFSTCLKTFWLWLSESVTVLVLEWLAKYSCLSSLFFVCVCTVCVSAQVWAMCGYECVWCPCLPVPYGGQKRVSGVLLYHYRSCSLRRGLTECGVHWFGWASCQCSLGIYLSLLHCRHHHSLLLWGQGPELRPHACVTSPLSPQLLSGFHALALSPFLWHHLPLLPPLLPHCNGFYL